MKSILDTVQSGEYKVGQAVDLIIHSQTDLGFKAIVNSKHWGLLFHQEVFQPLSKGQEIKGYVKKIREDGKLDLILYQEGNKDSKEIGERIIESLQEAGGFLPITDKTSPEDIYEYYSVSKKKFKIGLSGLYKKRLIKIENDGIYLVKTSADSNTKKQRPT